MVDNFLQILQLIGFISLFWMIVYFFIFVVKWMNSISDLKQHIKDNNETIIRLKNRIDNHQDHIKHFLDLERITNNKKRVSK